MRSTILLDSIKKLRECFVSTTAALAPYPTGLLQSKNRVWRVKENKPGVYSVHCSDGSMIKCSFHSKEAAQKECDKRNGEN